MHRFNHTVKCRDEECTVRLERGVRFCEAHDWMIQRWLQKSREMLERIKNSTEVKSNG